ncbi:hypothetical protein Prudu_016444, partial [Prunus dulcis]
IFTSALSLLARNTLSLLSLSLFPTSTLSSVRAAPATAGPETGPDRSASTSRSSLGHFPRRKPRTPAASSTGSNRACSPSRRRLRRPNLVTEVD